MSTNDETQAPLESQAGAETSPPAPPPAPAAPAAFGFGTAKGSGLSRGKRQAPPAAPVAPTTASASEAYIPTAIQIVEPERENFGGFGAKQEAPKSEIAKHVDSRPEVVRQHIAPKAPAAPKPVAAKPAPQPEAARPALTPAEPEAVEQPEIETESHDPAELNILPTEPRKVQEHRWDRSTDSAGRRDDSRRDGSAGRPHDRGPNREGRGRDFRRDGRPGDRRDEARPSSPSPEMPRSGKPTPAKSGGLLGWIKGLFGGKPAATPAPEVSRPQDGEHRGGRRRRSRGGRGRGDFQGRGPQGDPQGGGGQGGQGGERRFEGGRGGQGGGGGGGRRRRSRGGRGRDDRRGGEDQGVRGGGGI